MTNTEATTDTRTAAVAEHGAHVAPQKATSQRAANQKKGAPKANKTKQAAPKKAAKPSTSKRAAKKPVQPTSKKVTPAATETRNGSKKATILELLRRPKGATVTEIAEATNWQHHSIRGLISGTLRKKMGMTVESSKNESGDRRYRTGK